MECKNYKDYKKEILNNMLNNNLLFINNELILIDFILKNKINEDEKISFDNINEISIKDLKNNLLNLKKKLESELI